MALRSLSQLFYPARLVVRFLGQFVGVIGEFEGACSVPVTRRILAFFVMLGSSSVGMCGFLVFFGGLYV
jgi:hypothetical protein